MPTQAAGWLAHTTRAAITGLRKRGYAVPVPTERRQRLLDGVWSWRALVTGRIEGLYLCRDGRPKLEPSATASPPRIGSFADRHPERDFLSVLLDQPIPLL
jgi:hypothetical protein